jgi:hypothetical protein
MAKDVPQPLTLCVCGWYGWPEFYRLMRRVSQKRTVEVVAHREIEAWPEATIIPNEGLEWGTYDYFLRNLWDGKSNVFFAHDDVEITDPGIFEDIADLADASFVFKSRESALENGAGGFRRIGMHGRAFFLSAAACANLKGFWWDKTGNADINSGVIHLYEDLQRLKIPIWNSIFPEYEYARRGEQK